MLKYIEGSVCAPKGFKAAGVHCGFRKNKKKKDLALIVSERNCSVAAAYTQNKVKGAPIEVTRNHLQDGFGRAIICNSGNANTCAANGMYIAEEVCRMTAQALGCRSDEVIVASTGVIGRELTTKPFERGIPQVVEELSDSGHDAAAEAILTTDKMKKAAAVSFQLNGKSCTIGGIAKGSGMVHPNMATVLSFLTTDVAITPGMLQAAFDRTVRNTYNQVSIDGETSTNDMAVIMANGMAGNEPIENRGADFDLFCRALEQAASNLVKQIADDGEGASKTLICQVINTPTAEIARNISRSIVSSGLVKTAMFGEDANWGRILCAIGYTPGDFDTQNIDVRIESALGFVDVCRESSHVDFDEKQASKVLSAEEITIRIDMNAGEENATAWGCDLTYDYVKINGDYRS